MSKAKPIKKKKDYTVPILGGVFAAVLILMVVVLCIPKEAEKGEFVPPAFDSAAVKGTPEVDETLGYTELYQDGMAYRVSVCGVVTMDGKDAVVYFTNAESNEKYLKLRVLDTEGNILGESGLLKPGEYVKSVELTEKLAAGTKIKLKIMGYEPEDYSSAGSVSLNVTVGGASN